MISDASLIKIFTKYDNFTKYYMFVNFEVISKETYNILEAFEVYYKLNPNDIDFNSFVPWFFQTIATDYKTDKYEYYRQVFDFVDAMESNATIDDVLNFFNRKLVQKLFNEAMEKGQDDAELVGILNQLKNTLNTKQWHINSDFTSVSEANDRTKGLHWRLKCLDECVGPLIKGDLITVAANVEVGKTTFAASEASFMARQVTEGDVLWFNNEEPDMRVLRKLHRAVLGVSENVLLENPEGCEQEYIRRLHGDLNRIKIIDITKKTIKDLRMICKSYDPRLMIIDVGDKLESLNKTFAEHDRLGKVYGDLRGLAREYCPVMVFSQTSNDVKYWDIKEQKYQYIKYLEMSHLAGSKVGKPGEADVVIMIAQDPVTPDLRYINIPKNKISTLDGIKRKGRFCVRIKPEISQYQDIIGETTEE